MRRILWLSVMIGSGQGMACCATRKRRQAMTERAEGLGKASTAEHIAQSALRLALSEVEGLVADGARLDADA